MAENIVNNLTIKASCDHRIIDPFILKPFPEDNYEPLYVCDESSIIFGTRNNIILFCNRAYVKSRDRYMIETTNNTMEVMKDNLLVSNTMNNLPIHKY